MSARSAPGGEPDVAIVATLFAEPTRARVLAALADGRSLPASVLAAEAGVSPSATSTHLTRLRDAGLVTTEQSGRHRYYRLADDRVAHVLEVLSELAPQRPIRSLRQHTRAAALRHCRSCYDHLAGHVGVAVTAGLLGTGALESVDGVDDTRRRDGEPLSAVLTDCPYRLGPVAADVFAGLGVDLDSLIRPPSRTRRPLLRVCMDWSEQHHHVSGALGAALLTSLRRHDWVRAGRHRRTLVVTDSGAARLRSVLGVDVR